MPVRDLALAVHRVALVAVAGMSPLGEDAGDPRDGPVGAERLGAQAQEAEENQAGQR
jgi:hypothetical protein